MTYSTLNVCINLCAYNSMFEVFKSNTLHFKTLVTGYSEVTLSCSEDQ